MTTPALVKPVPWDTAALGVPCFELRDASPEALAQAQRTPGHHSVRVAPRASTRLLHEHGFFYCDTLLEPHCRRERFKAHPCGSAAATRETRLEQVLAICHGAFTHGRFHRDFTVDPARADERYDRWLAQLHAEGRVYGLLHERELAGFVAAVGGRLVLHALAVRFQGRGLAAGLWTAVCNEVFAAGEQEITSSISAANLPAINLYASLGFGFRNAADVYHRMVA
jgi:ribosomal protein S18 acetylase RimI-like enzyme